MSIMNKKLQEYPFLKDMYEDGYFPNTLVDKGRDILTTLCQTIEKEQPTTLKELYPLTHKATESFNSLAEEFEEHDSEIETAARETIALDFDTIARAYNFTADLEELIAPRDW